MFIPELLSTICGTLNSSVSIDQVYHRLIYPTTMKVTLSPNALMPWETSSIVQAASSEVETCRW